MRKQQINPNWRTFFFKLIYFNWRLITLHEGQSKIQLAWILFKNVSVMNQSVLKKSTLNIHWKDWCWSWSSNTLATWCEDLFIGKDPDSRKDWRQEEKGTSEDKTVGWHHQPNRHEFEQTPGDGERWGRLVCCKTVVCRGHKKLDTT